MVQHTISVSTWFGFFLYIEHLGERALAISNITRGASGLIWVVLMAFSSTCSTLVSNIIGEGHQDKVMSLVRRILKLSYGIVGSIILIYCLFPEAIARIYTDMPDIVQASAPALIVMACSYLFHVGGQVLFLAVSGTGNTSAALYLESAVLVVYILFIMAMTHLTARVELVWTAEILYGALLGILCYLYLKFAKWSNKRI